MRANLEFRGLSRLLLSAALATALHAHATEAAHVHGLMRLDIAVEKQLLTVQLESPLDSLLGFEHRPSTPAQRQAADALLKQMADAGALFKPDAAAQCKPTKTTVESPALQSAPPASGKEDEHADLDASYEFTCAQPDKLSTVEIGLFDAFSRLQKIEIQVAGTKGQSKQTLKRPDKRVALTR